PMARTAEAARVTADGTEARGGPRSSGASGSAGRGSSPRPRDVRGGGCAPALIAIRSLVLAMLMGATGCAEREAPDPVRAERDRILSLTAMAVVHRDWQRAPGGRGHNIGAVIADR